MARAWEDANPRPYLYAGVGAGADAAAWKQAARAESAAAIRNAEYGQTLLDVVKAFNRAPHDILVREAIALCFSLWVLPLSLVAYSSERRIRIEGKLSDLIRPYRGITAGSGLATTEMRVVMLRIVDRAWRNFPTVTPTLFVDDLAAESSGGPATVAQQLVGFTSQVCNEFAECMPEVSVSKSICSASTPSLRAALQRSLVAFGIRYEAWVKSLGSALGAGRRRNAGPLNARLKAFRARAGRFRALRRAGVSTDRLVRTGGISALTYG